MLADTAVSEVQQICGWRTDKATQILNALQYAQNERERPGRTFPWFLRTQNDSAIVTVAGTSQYNLPSDYIQDTEEKEGNLFVYTGGSGVQQSRTVFLRKGDFESLQVRYFGAWPWVASTASDVTDNSDVVGPGVPIDYYLGSTFVILYPVPDAVYNVSWRYWAKDTAPALGAENKWLANAPWVLIADAALKIAADLGYQQGIETAKGLLQGAEANLFRAVIAREEAGRRRSMGSKL